MCLLTEGHKPVRLEVGQSNTFLKPEIRDARLLAGLLSSSVTTQAAPSTGDAQKT